MNSEFTSGKTMDPSMAVSFCEVRLSNLFDMAGVNPPSLTANPSDLLFELDEVPPFVP